MPVDKFGRMSDAKTIIREGNHDILNVFEVYLVLQTTPFVF